MKKLFALALTFCFSTQLLYAQDKSTQDPDRQAKIEKALKRLNDKDMGSRREAIWTLASLDAKECAKDIAELLNY